MMKNMIFDIYIYIQFNVKHIGFLEDCGISVVLSVWGSRHITRTKFDQFEKSLCDCFQAFALSSPTSYTRDHTIG